MKLLIFPAAVALLVIGSWLAFVLIDACLLGHTDAKFGCLSSVTIATVFACISAAIVAVAAVLARIAVHRFLPFGSAWQEIVAALLSSVVLVLAFYAMVTWRIGIGGMAGIFFGWLMSSFAICTATLLIVNRLFNAARRNGT